MAPAEVVIADWGKSVTGQLLAGMAADVTGASGDQDVTRLTGVFHIKILF
jgi:hypothetical protein